MTHDHHHDHDHSELTETQLRVRALESVLTEKGYVDPAALDLLIETYETKVGPRNGAQVVAKAWTDPAYRHRLLADGSAAIAAASAALNTLALLRKSTTTISFPRPFILTKERDGVALMGPYMARSA